MVDNFGTLLGETKSSPVKLIKFLINLEEKTVLKYCELCPSMSHFPLFFSNSADLY
jgi:hypothetical protein